MYDFISLSAYDFEILVRDLLQKHLGIFLESFKSGRDQGIDLRYAPALNKSLIVQCKHYVGTGYSGLLVALKKEVVKVKRLSPMRYCVATSVPLSPTNKEEIHRLFPSAVLQDSPGYFRPRRPKQFARTISGYRTKTLQAVANQHNAAGKNSS